MPETPVDGTPATGALGRAISVRAGLLIALAGIIVAGGATVLVLRGGRGTGGDVILGAVALLAFGVAAYGLIQAVLALVDTAGERRRHDRDVTERRHGDRAREPRKG